MFNQSTMSNTRNYKDIEKILYIEDDPDIQRIAVVALEHVGGFCVRVASSGIEGCSLAVEFQPDLILLDVMMPGMDGLATLEKLRANAATDAIPVVLMTAKAQRQEINLYHKSGAVSVIAKPFDPMNLAEQVRAIWQHIHWSGD
jgi:two-component system OmpR family response regulator